MIFKIMTDKEMDVADNLTLRERVRELSKLTNILINIHAQLVKTDRIIREIAHDHTVLLSQIQANTHKKKRRPRKTKSKRR